MVAAIDVNAEPRAVGARTWGESIARITAAAVIRPIHADRTLVTSGSGPFGPAVATTAAFLVAKRLAGVVVAVCGRGAGAGAIRRLAVIIRETAVANRAIRRGVVVRFARVAREAQPEVFAGAVAPCVSKTFHAGGISRAVIRVAAGEGTVGVLWTIVFRTCTAGDIVELDRAGAAVAAVPLLVTGAVAAVGAVPGHRCDPVNGPTVLRLARVWNA